MDLFGSTQAPRWLSIDERQSLYEKMASEETAGFASAFNNAFNSAQNKDAAIAKQRLKGMESDNKMKTIAAEEAEKEHAAWIKDQPTVIPWLTASPDKRSSMEVPAVTSQTGLDAIMKTRAADEQYLLRKQNAEWLNNYRQGQLEIKKDQLEHNSSMQKLDGAFKEGMSRIAAQDPTRLAAIRQEFESTGQEWADKDGFLSPAAQVAIGTALSEMGLPGVSAFEQKQALQAQRGETQKAVAEIGATSREKVQGMRGEQAEKIEGMREKARGEIEKAKGQLKSLQIQYNIKQKRLDTLSKDPILAMAPDKMGKAMAAVREKKESELSKLSSEVDALSEKMDALNSQIEAGPAEPGADYRPGSMNALPAPPKVINQEQANEAIKQANEALKKIGNNKELRQKVLDKLKALGVDFTLGTNAPAATSTNAIANP